MHTLIAIKLLIYCRHNVTSRQTKLLELQVIPPYTVYVYSYAGHAQCNLWFRYGLPQFRVLSHIIICNPEIKPIDVTFCFETIRCRNTSS